MKALITVRTNVGLRRWQQEDILMSNCDSANDDIIYEWLYEHFKDKYPESHDTSYLSKFYPAKNRRPVMFRVIKIKLL